MKKLVVFLVLFFVSTMTFAADCVIKTSKGVINGKDCYWDGDTLFFKNEGIKYGLDKKDIISVDTVGTEPLPVVAPVVPVGPAPPPVGPAPPPAGPAPPVRP